MAGDRKMNSNMRKKIMAILLSGVICVSNCVVPSFASEAAMDTVAESETDEEKGTAADIVEENQGEVENTGSEQEKEGVESGTEAEQADEEIIVDNTEDNSARVLEET